MEIWWMTYQFVKPAGQKSDREKINIYTQFNWNNHEEQSYTYHQKYI